VFSANWLPTSGYHRVSLRIYKNLGNFKFKDMTDQWLSGFNPQWGVDGNFQIKDIDGNGAPDILYSGYVPPGQPDLVDNGNGIFLNDGTGKMQRVMHDEFVAWGLQFQQDHAMAMYGTPSFYPYLTAAGKTDFLVFTPTGRVGDDPAGIALGSLLTDIDFNSACGASVPSKAAADRRQREASHRH
jgi:hypothetical protein